LIGVAGCPTRPSDTLPKSVIEIRCVIESMWFGFGEGLAMGIFLYDEKRSRVECPRDRFD